ncbi:MAG: alpha-amylase family glycosyl hydrolase, partial [Myxococcota bacterium]
TQAVRPAALKERDRTLDENWFHEPFYYTYVQYFGTDDEKTTATFDNLIKQLDYLEEAGIKNLFLLPHYESPMGDGGYDVSDFSPRQDLGGKEAYERFMAAANERGFRVCTDLPLNHTSVKHHWFQEALAGDEEKLNYYLRRDGRERVGLEDRNGDLVAIYKDPDGTITERTLIFPDVDQEHGERFRLKDGREVNIYQEFYPFQLDLDLTNPALLREVFQLLGDELNQGVLGKRTDAIAHWIKKPGTTADGLDETHALHALLKSFSRHVSSKMIVLPEAVRGMDELKKYTGVETEIAGRKTASEGDALFNFQMQGALREMTYFQTTKPFWELAFQVPSLPANAQMLNLLEHHDETYLGMISDQNRRYLGEHIEHNGGMVYKTA